VAADEGVTLCALESMSNFSSRYMEERENNLAMMRTVLDLASDLGVGLVKVFAAWPGLVDDEEAVAMYAAYERGLHYKRLYPPDLRRWQRAVEGIREVADWAANLGITVALQNHAPVTTPGYEDALAMVREIDRPNLKLCLDAPLFYERQSDAYVREAVRECGGLVVHTHYGAWNFRETGDGAIVQGPAPSFGGPINYEAFVPALHETGYTGFLTSEYCVAAVRDHRIAGIEEVDRGTTLALRYMKQIVARAVGPRQAASPQPALA
jgi:sugar phosphate isomerase/epimerase